ncbi:hypothetical protein QR98_0018540 [Sarcoptes scabiei]|uniref:Uncharacterized protein n=1 Tax=Sarcoptes scabiei TaxID=52283 RepID=A0A131ZXL0_SARSC|nr:hypothetical protein QR98_0018540 [Sarcoptes scabiei]
MLTALFGAIEEGNLQFIQELFVTSNIDPNQCNKNEYQSNCFCLGFVSTYEILNHSIHIR